MNDDQNAARSWAAAGAALTLHAINGVTTALIGRFPVPLDELQHLSFIRAMERAPRLLPRYQDLHVLDARAQTFTSAPNYLYHASPYYLVMGLIDQATAGSIAGLRAANLVLSLCAIAVLLAAGFRVLAGWRERAVFALALVMFPKIGVVAGLINNDNAALFAVACGFLGLIEWHRRPSARSAAILAVGLALCGWTKLTALMMLGSGAAIAEALGWFTARRGARLSYAILAAGLAVAAIPYVANFVAYGRLFYHSSAFYVPPAQRVTLSFAGYAGLFFTSMAHKWSALEPSRALPLLGFYTVLALAAASVWVGTRRLRARGSGADLEQAGWRVACGLILATMPVLAMHLYFGWRSYLEDGYADMAQMRYYYGVWPGFALGLALLWKSQASSLSRTAVTGATAALLMCASICVLGPAAVA